MSVAYPILDVDGTLVAVHVRTEGPDGKRMHWRLPDGTAGLNGTPAADLPLYGIHRMERRSVVICEGERAAQALMDAGMTAVGTVTGAAGAPSPKALSELAGKIAYVWPDNDDVGRSHMEKVARRLQIARGTTGLGGFPVADLPLYGVHRAERRSVIVCEGERAAQALIDAGMTAVGTVTGASAPSPKALSDLAGKVVFLWPDADDVGRSHMAKIGANLEAIAASVQWIEPPPDAPKGWDAEEQRIGVRNPRQVGGGEAQVRGHRRHRHAHDGRAEDQHELGRRQQRQHEP